jgi:hypothetical protein
MSDNWIKGLKRNLPTKNCVVCQKPFQYRKKWKEVWSEVKYCSQRCKNNSKVKKI